jgi:hypothetical protein
MAIRGYQNIEQRLQREAEAALFMPQAVQIKQLQIFPELDMSWQPP